MSSPVRRGDRDSMRIRETREQNQLKAGELREV